MIIEREIFLTDPEEKAKVVEFLKGFDLTFTGIIDYTMGLLMMASSSALVRSAGASCEILRSAAIISEKV